MYVHEDEDSLTKKEVYKLFLCTSGTSRGASESMAMTVPSEVSELGLRRGRALRGAVLPGAGNGGDKRTYSTAD